MLSRIFSQFTGRGPAVPAPAQALPASRSAEPAAAVVGLGVHAQLRIWVRSSPYPAYDLYELLADPVRAQAAALIASRGDVSLLEPLLRQLVEREDSAPVDQMLLAEALFTRGAPAQAEEALLTAAALPGRIAARACVLLGERLFYEGRFDQAHAMIERAAALAPEAMLCQILLGLWCDYEGRTAAALTHFQRAVDARPDSVDARVGLAMAWLRCDDLQAGFREWVTAEYLAGSYKQQTVCPVWDGRPLLRDRLLIQTVNYFGDIIQFLRYAHHLRAREPEARLSIVVPAALASLAADTGLFEHVYTGAAAREGFDWQVTQTHLALLLDVPLQGLTRYEPYLRIPAAHAQLAAAWLPARRPGRLRVGLRWAGLPKAIDRKRSVPFDCLRPLFAVPDIDWVALVEDPAALAGLGAHPMLDVCAHLSDFAATGALLLHLDLIITVDTSMVHLAGALQRPTWLLARPDPEWRWGATADHSPWYSSVRIFRHPQGLDWNASVAVVARALALHVAAGKQVVS